MFNVLIRPLKTDDAKISYRWRNNPEIWRLTGTRPDTHITEELETDWITSKLREENSKRFAILANNEYVGNIQLTNIEPKDTAEYHIFIGEKKIWGKGVAQLATLQLLYYAKEILNLKQVHLFVNPQNIAAIKVYEKCGFIKVSDAVRMNIKLSKLLPPKLSVFLMTYNHEKYIEQAIDSILMQKVDFAFEIVIGEDCSTDSTRSKIKKIANEYPGKFKLLLHNKNIGAHSNQSSIFNACTGQYMALLEGDDYWIDPYKVEKQVDFLERNPDYGMVCTDYNKYFEQSNSFKLNCFRIEKYADSVSFENYLLDRSTIGTATTLLRKNIYEDYTNEIPEKIRYSFNVGDTPLWLYIALKSKIKVMPEATAVYRILGNSACHFENIHDHYSFIMKGFSVPDYFLSNYSVSETIKIKNEVLKLKQTMNYAFKIKNKKIFIDSYKIVEDLYKSCSKTDYVKRIGITNNTSYYLITKFLKLINKI